MHRSRGTLLALSALGAGTILAAPVRAEPADFSGPHVGVEAEYLWGKIDPEGFDDAGDDPIPGHDGKDVLGGASAGYDWQSDGLVFGLFGSVAFGKVEASSPLTTLTIQGNEGVTIEHHGFSTDLTLLAKLGGRIGAVVADNILVYAKGGVALGRLRITETGDNAAADRKTTPTGYVAGAGIDVRLDDNWIVGVSWEHVDLGDEPFTPQAYGPGTVRFSGESAKLGIRFRF